MIFINKSGINNPLGEKFFEDKIKASTHWICVTIVFPRHCANFGAFRFFFAPRGFLR
jgi:hypothetical protein